MNLIVAVDKNWAIGKNGNLLVKIPEDQKFFREETLGKVVVMGRKTLNSFPNGTPLAGRINVVLTREKDMNIKNAVVKRSVEETLKYLKKFRSEDIYVIGGGSIYEQFLPYCNVAHVTKINYGYDGDTYFPNLDKNDEWILAGDSDEHTYFDLEYFFKLYVRKLSK